jgi:branched-chain amino acid transport system ATP-binding protein
MLALGRALLAHPRILLLDEPSLGLAPLVVNEVFAIIRELQADGMTILLIEQNARKALGIAQRGYVLETGSVVREGPAEQLSEDPVIRRVYLSIASE